MYQTHSLTPTYPKLPTRQDKQGYPSFKIEVNISLSKEDAIDDNLGLNLDITITSHARKHCQSPFMPFQHVHAMIQHMYSNIR